MDKKLKHLEFLQGIINRLSAAGFQMKGWSIVLVSGLLVLKDGRTGQDGSGFLLLCPVFMFWILDGFFLSRERHFRALYDHVRKLPEGEVDFSMDVKCVRRKLDWGRAAGSWTLLVFYGVLAAIVVGANFLD